jgi:GTP cyclohydrolase I
LGGPAIETDQTRLHLAGDRIVQDLIRQLLARMGEYPDRERLRRRSARVQKALEYFTAGYRMDIGSLFVGDARGR